MSSVSDTSSTPAAKQIAGQPVVPVGRRLQAALWDVLFFAVAQLIAVILALVAIFTSVFVMVLFEGSPVYAPTTVSPQPSPVAWVPVIVAGIIVCLAPYLYFIHAPREYGGTLGMRLVGLRLVRHDGSPVDWWRIVLRGLIALLLLVPVVVAIHWITAGRLAAAPVPMRGLTLALSLVPLVLNWLWALVEPFRRTWPDLAAGTYMVEDVHHLKPWSLRHADTEEGEGQPQ
jgi:uncharacterized RDD family membrane protein YckC